MTPDPRHKRLEATLWERIHRHLPADVIKQAGLPTIEWQPGGWPPIGETVLFKWENEDLETTVSFAPDDAVLVRLRTGGMIRMDAWRTGQRGVVFDWRHEDADLN